MSSLSIGNVTDTRGYGPRSRSRLVLLGLGFVLVLVYGVLGVSTGVTIDNDSGALLDSFRSILDGDYRVSRTSGFPLYEFSGALAYFVGGVRAAMSLSLLATLAALAVLIQPTRALRSWPGILAWLGLAITPIVLTNASGVIETATLMLMVALLAWGLSTERLSSTQRSAWLLVVMFALILTRSDSLILGGATFIALFALWLPQRSTNTVPWTALSVVAGMLIGLTALWIITSRNPLSSEFLPAESLVRRILRGAVGTTILFGPVGVLALALLALTLILLVWKLRPAESVDRDLSPLASPRFTTWWLAATLLLYGLRFLALPDELEYLMPLLVVLAVTVSSLMVVSRLAGTLALVVLWSAVATGLVTLSLLGRSTPWQPSPTIQLSLQPGAWTQDLQSRRAAQVRSTEEYRDFLTDSLGPLQQGIDEGSATLIPRDTWNYVLNPGYARFYDQFDSILGCDSLVADTLIPGWRVSQPAATFEDISVFDEGRTMNCEVVALISGPVVTPVNSGRDFGAEAEYQRP